MRRLLPPTEPPDAPLDPVEHVWARPRPAPEDRPWVLANMVASADGGIAVQGRSGGLGGPADRDMFHALREVPDVILAAAGTVRAERYQPPSASEPARVRRAAHGRAPVPRLAIVSGSLRLDLDAPIFTDTEVRPLVITGGDAPAERRAAVAERAEVVEAGADRADLADGLAQLRQRGVEVVLCEGGPSLLGQLVAEDLVDELCLTLSPSLVGGSGPRITSGGADVHESLVLHSVCEQDDLLFLCYLRPR